MVYNVNGSEYWTSKTNTHKMNVVDIDGIFNKLHKSTRREQNDRMWPEIIHHILHKTSCAEVSR